MRYKKWISPVAALLVLAAASAKLWYTTVQEPSDPHEDRIPTHASGHKTSHIKIPKGQVIQGKVVKVSDGDTVRVLLEDHTELRVRLLGIDAPEKSQPFGEVCRETLAQLIAGRVVRVETAGTDRYGRTLGKILIDGKDANLAQIEAGCAWHYKQFAKSQSPQDREIYSSKELKARSQKKGLWRDSTPQAPWSFRHRDVSSEIPGVAPGTAPDAER